MEQIWYDASQTLYNRQTNKMDPMNISDCYVEYFQGVVQEVGTQRELRSLNELRRQSLVKAGQGG